MPMPFLPTSVYGDGADAGYGLPLPMSIADKTAVAKQSGAMKPGNPISWSFPLNEIARDYTDGQWYSPLPLAAGAVDMGLNVGSLVNPTAKTAKKATALLNNAPKIITQDKDYWKKLGKKDRAYRAEQMNKLKADLRSALTPPIPYVEHQL